MKKIYLIFITLFTIHTSWGQSLLEITPKDTFYVEFDASAEGKASFDVKNNSNAAVDITWERQDLSHPSAWEFTVCDPNNCYLPAVKSKNFTLGAGMKGNIILDAFANDVPGTAWIRVKLTPKGGASQLVKVRFNGKKSSKINDIAINNMNIVPNPANDFFRFNNLNDNIKTVQVINLTGRIVKTFDAYEGANYDISELVKGTYFVSLLNQSGKKLTTKRLIVQ